MANFRVQKKFVNGVHKVYKKMFSSDISYFSLREGIKDPLYDEYTSMGYKDPVLLTGKVNLAPDPGDTPPQEQRYTAKFTITLKSLRQRGLEVEDHEKHKELRKGYLSYQGVDYTINEIDPVTFVADAFLVYDFKCTERK